MKRMAAIHGVLVALTVASSAAGCPVCGSAVGEQVRAGIFDDRFGINVLLTLLPYVILLAIVAIVYYGERLPGQHCRSIIRMVHATVRSPTLENAPRHLR